MHHLNIYLNLRNVRDVLEGKTDHATWRYSNKEDINIVHVDAHYYHMTPLNNSCTSNQLNQRGDMSNFTRLFILLLLTIKRRRKKQQQQQIETQLQLEF